MSLTDGADEQPLYDPDSLNSKQRRGADRTFKILAAREAKKASKGNTSSTNRVLLNSQHSQCNQCGTLLDDTGARYGEIYFRYDPSLRPSEALGPTFSLRTPLRGVVAAQCMRQASVVKPKAFDALCALASCVKSRQCAHASCCCAPSSWCHGGAADPKAQPQRPP